MFLVFENAAQMIYLVVVYNTLKIAHVSPQALLGHIEDCVTIPVTFYYTSYMSLHDRIYRASLG